MKSALALSARASFRRPYDTSMARRVQPRFNATRRLRASDRKWKHVISKEVITCCYDVVVNMLAYHWMKSSKNNNDDVLMLCYCTSNNISLWCTNKYEINNVKCQKPNTLSDCRFENKEYQPCLLLVVKISNFWNNFKISK